MINPSNTTSMALYQFNKPKLDGVDELSTSKNSDEKLQKGAAGFEAVFLTKMFQTMDSTVERSDFLNGGSAEETFRGMFYQEIANQVSSNPATSLGVAQQVYSQMKDKI